MFRTAARRFLEPELDANRVGRVHREYDRGHGYDDYHAACRRAFGRTVPEGVSPLLADGFERLRVMNASDAGAFLAEVKDRFRCRSFRRNADRIRSYEIDDPDFTRRLLAAAFTPDVETRVTRFFRSEYLVHWYVVTRAEPRPAENFNSFLWHCDRGPGAHLKLLVYLNGFDEHGGWTEFLDLATTREMERSGYLFGSVADRRADLAPLAAQVGSALQPRSWRLQAGEALLFQPRNVLHRGRMPSHRERYMLSICLLPSPVPWREALDSGVMSDLARDPKWHRNAMSVLPLLGLAGR